jgi:hypothetical protein
MSICQLTRKRRKETHSKTDTRANANRYTKAGCSITWERVVHRELV